MTARAEQEHVFGVDGSESTRHQQRQQRPYDRMISDDGWSQYYDSQDFEAERLVDSLPPQLHPAVSMGLRRVSSCYLSLNSASDGSDAAFVDSEEMWELLNEDKAQNTDTGTSSTSKDWSWDVSDVLYHDIMMHVFTFLDAHSLAAFSETARRPNFECFYFLQLQLQRALLTEPAGDHFSAIAGSHCISRLARVDRKEAQDIVQEYLNSNSTLRMMPLSHSLAYIREVLRTKMGPQIPASQTQALARAALLIAVVGAASVLGGASDGMVGDSFGTEVPNMLFRVGFVGSLMGAAHKMSEQGDHMSTASMRERAEHMARTMQELPAQLFQRMRDEAADAAVRFPSLMRMMPMPFHPLTEEHTESETKEEPTEIQPLTPNPYEHLPAEMKEDEGGKNPFALRRQSMWRLRKLPSGCVGAYFRAVQRATSHLTQWIKETRKSNFAALSETEQHDLSAAFIDACCSDERLPVVLDLVRNRAAIDPEGFYVGADGTETCALHAAAFHGACRVLEFLCSRIDEHDASEDGGLCDVNCKDANGWTAAHFAAGANSPAAIEILAQHGAHLNLEAVNGYTPLQWAQRLSNEEAVEELQRRVGKSKPFQSWSASQRLSALANRFFAIIPTAPHHPHRH